MILKRVKDLEVGERFKFEEKEFEVVKMGVTQPIIKEVGNSGTAAWPMGLHVSSYDEEAVVVIISSTSKEDLTSQLREQVNKNSLTESFRSQIESSDSNPEVSINKNGISFSNGLPIVEASEGVVIECKDAKEAKKAVLSADLKSQVALNKTEEASDKIEDLEEEVQDVYDYSKAVSDVAHNALYHAEDAQATIAEVEERIDDVQNYNEELDNRISALEQKQLEEETKMNLQESFNQKLAQQKSQKDLQAQLNQSLKNQKTTGGNGTMKNVLGAFKGLFGKVEGKFAFSPATGGLAIRKGISQEFVAFDANTKSITDVTGLTLDFNVPAFKLPVTATEVKAGDIVLNGADFGYVTRVNDGFVETIVPEKNTRGSVLPTKNVLFGNTFYTVVKTLDAAGEGGFNPMLLLAMGDGNKDELVKMMALTGGLGGSQNGQIDPTMLMLLGDNVDELLPFFLMQQGGVASQGFNPLMLLALKDKGGSSESLLPLLAMSQGAQGGQGGFNPMMLLAMGDDKLDLTTLALMGGFGGQGLFGNQPVTPAQPKEEKAE